MSSGSVERGSIWRIHLGEGKIRLALSLVSHIPEETWEKMLQILSPGCFRECELKDILEVLPFYDKYQFVDGIRLCDRALAGVLESRVEGTYIPWEADEIEAETSMIVMSVDLGLHLSKSIAIELAKHRVQRQKRNVEDLKRLFPIVENDETSLRILATLLHGRNGKAMSLDEIRLEAKEEGYAAKIVQRRDIVVRLERKILTKFSEYEFNGYDSVMNLAGPGIHDLLCREYRYICCSRRSDHEVLGVMKCRCVARSTLDDFLTSRKFFIEPSDVFGNEWEIVEYIPDDDLKEDEMPDLYTINEVNSTRKVFYRWNGGYSSYLVPEKEWQHFQDP